MDFEFGPGSDAQKGIIDQSWGVIIDDDGKKSCSSIL